MCSKGRIWSMTGAVQEEGWRPSITLKVLLQGIQVHTAYVVQSLTDSCLSSWLTIALHMPQKLHWHIRAEKISAGKSQKACWEEVFATAVADDWSQPQQPCPVRCFSPFHTKQDWVQESHPSSDFKLPTSTMTLPAGKANGRWSGVPYRSWESSWKRDKRQNISWVSCSLGLSLQWHRDGQLRLLWGIDMHPSRANFRMQNGSLQDSLNDMYNGACSHNLLPCTTLSIPWK